MKSGWGLAIVPDLDEPPSVNNQAVAFEPTGMRVKSSRPKSKVVHQIGHVLRQRVHYGPVSARGLEFGASATFHSPLRRVNGFCRRRGHAIAATIVQFAGASLLPSDVVQTSPTVIGLTENRSEFGRVGQELPDLLPTPTGGGGLSSPLQRLLA